MNEDCRGRLHGGCGAVRFTAPSTPLRTGLCHCLTCRKAHASAFNPFAVYKISDITWSGDLTSWESSPGYDRRFCPRCGSRVLAILGEEVELKSRKP